MEDKLNIESLVGIAEKLLDLAREQATLETADSDFFKKALQYTHEIQTTITDIQAKQANVLSAKLAAVEEEAEQLRQTRARLLNLVEHIDIQNASTSSHKEPQKIEEEAPKATLHNEESVVIEEAIIEEPVVETFQPKEVVVEHSEPISKPIERTATKPLEQVIQDEQPVRGLNEILEKRALSDIRRSLSINDRFRFRREVFGGNDEKMSQALDALQACTSLEESMDYIKNVLGLSSDDEVSAEFIKLIEKRFS